MKLLYNLENKEMHRSRGTFLHETELLCFLIASVDVLKLLYFLSRVLREPQTTNPFFKPSTQGLPTLSSPLPSALFSVSSPLFLFSSLKRASCSLLQSRCCFELSLFVVGEEGRLMCSGFRSMMGP